MRFYNSSIDEVISEFSSDINNGINSIDVKDRLNRYGKNVLVKKRNRGVLKKFISQFDNVMILILVFSAVVSFFIALNSGSGEEFLEPIVILFIVFLNASLGTIQESKAEKTLEELNKMSATHCRVIRDGKEMFLDTSMLVPGDIVLLSSGDIVPADCRIIYENGLKVDESFLTGESELVVKHSDTITCDVSSIGDIYNMVFSGSYVMMGNCKVIVCGVGMSTEIGKIAFRLNESEDNKSPIENKLEVLSRYIGLGAIILCFIIFTIGVLNGSDIRDMFMISISLAVAAIPEGLPALVTIVFALGVQKMAKKNAIIRKLPSVEALGSASVICSDKTGTLTENKLSLVGVYVDEIKDIKDINDKDREVIKYGRMCISQGEDPIDIAIKEKTEIYSKNIDYDVLYEIPFDSNRKCMSVVVRYKDKKYVIVKGAYEVIKSKCKFIGDGVKSNVDKMSLDGLRIICIATKELKGNVIKNSEYLERDLEFKGVLAFKDTIRAGVIDSVRTCKMAGIKPVMITGDYILTAKAIAKEVGIFEGGDIAISGDTLHKMSDESLYDSIEKISVYARVNPEDKIRIVRMWQKKNKVVAMTGDGVNDAPALKVADIGCAMGRNGTEVAKNAADLILVDDNFSTIVESVKEGRNIYDNVKRAILFLLGTNMGEIFTMLFAMLFWQISPLLSMQLLWVNLVTDIAPALAIGMEEASDEVMRKRPKDKEEKILSLGSFRRLIFQGMLFASLVLFAFLIGKKENLVYARTMAFIVISLSQLFHAFNVKSDKSILSAGILSNKYLVYGTVLTLLLMLWVCFIPFLNSIFVLCILKIEHYLLCVFLSIVPVIVSEIKKALKKD